MQHEIDSLIIKIKGIETFPSVIQKINSMLEDDSVSIKDLAQIIEKDPSITATVLRLSNSSYYGLRSKVTTISRAITILGFNTVRNITTSASLMRFYSHNFPKEFDPKGLWHHCLGCAISSKALLLHTNDDIKEEAFICGLIHDIGKVVQWQVIPDKMRLVLEKLKSNQEATEIVVEKDILGFTHAYVGARLAQLWHFPERYYHAILLHHSPKPLIEQSEQKDIDNETKLKSLLAASIYIGNQLSKALALGSSTNKNPEFIDPDVWSLMALSEKDLENIIITIKNNYLEMSRSLHL